MKNIFIYLICVGLFPVCAQEVVVVNEQTKAPIVGAAVFNFVKTKTLISDLDGKLNLQAFQNFENIYFQHLSYNKLEAVKSSIKDSIFLSPKSTSLKEVVISASKFEQHKKEVPQNIVSINAEAIELANPQTSADLLTNTGRVFIQKSQLGGGSPMIRGFSTNRLLITVDGVRMNNAIFRGGNVQNIISIDPFTIENTEVILGGGSVIYGSDAIGGVMNFYTKSPRLTKSDTAEINSNATVRYASASSEKTGHIDLNFGFKKWGFLSSISFSDYGDLLMGRYGPDDYLRPEFVEHLNGQDKIVPNSSPRLQKFTGFNQTHFSQKIKYNASPLLKFDLGLNISSTSDYPRYDRLTQYTDDETLKYAQWDYGPQKWVLGHLQMTKLSARSRLFDKIKFSLAYQNFKESRISRKFNSRSQKLREENVDAFSVNFDFEKTISDPSKLFYGAEYIHNTVGSVGHAHHLVTNEATHSASRYPDGSDWQSIATYLTLKHKPNSKLTFQSGVRYNHIIIRSNLSRPNYPFDKANLNTGALTGTAGLSWACNEDLLLKLNTSTAFRAPNIDDIGKLFDSSPGAVVVPNDNLKPEYAYGAEISASGNLNTSISFDVSSYYTYLDNALVRKAFEVDGESTILYDGELSEVIAIQNASKAWISGIDLGLKILLNQHLKLTSQYSYIHGVQEDEPGMEMPVRHVSPTFGNTHLIWKKRKLIIDGFIAYNGALSASEISPELSTSLFATDTNGDPYAPSWYTLNLRSHYQFNPSTSFVVSIENMTNQRYRTYASGISAPGTNFIFSITYKK
jgi:hemoglobin/transferrin/lactoferrin receptor protein